MLYNVYCDETCHLEHDNSNVMVIGAVSCPQEKIKEINNRIKQIKKKNNININAEMKWTKISPSKVDAYCDLVNYFFDDDDLHFRAILIPDKKMLNHSAFGQTHDEWYYKMYFDMLKAIFDPQNKYEIYIDIKDTHSFEKAIKLRTICSNSLYDFSNSVIKRLQPIRSEEVQIMQIVDILIGATGYENRKFSSSFKKSSAKQNIVNLIKERSGYTMKKTTLLRENKYNLLIWEAQNIND